MTNTPIPDPIDWTNDATLFRWGMSGDWAEILRGQLHALVQAVNAAHDDAGDFYIETLDGARFVGNEIRLLGCDATRPADDVDPC